MSEKNCKSRHFACSQRRPLFRACFFFFRLLGIVSARSAPLPLDCLANSAKCERSKGDDKIHSQTLFPAPKIEFLVDRVRNPYPSTNYLDIWRHFQVADEFHTLATKCWDSVTGKRSSVFKSRKHFHSVYPFLFVQGELI